MSTTYPEWLYSYNVSDYEDGYDDGLHGRWANAPDPDEPNANAAYHAGFADGRQMFHRRLEQERRAAEAATDAT